MYYCAVDSSPCREERRAGNLKIKDGKPSCPACYVPGREKKRESKQS